VGDIIAGKIMQRIVMYAAGNRSYLKSFLRCKFLIWIPIIQTFYIYMSRVWGSVVTFQSREGFVSKNVWEMLALFVAVLHSGYWYFLYKWPLYWSLVLWCCDVLILLWLST